jgi:hypothetical protein
MDQETQMVDQAPMPTAEDLWRAKYQNHIVKFLTGPDCLWDVADAQEAAMAAYEATGHDFTEDPIECADGELDAWDAE